MGNSNTVYSKMAIMEEANKVLRDAGITDRKEILEQLEYVFNLNHNRALSKIRDFRIDEESKEDYNLRFFRGWNRALDKVHEQLEEEYTK